MVEVRREPAGVGLRQAASRVLSLGAPSLPLCSAMTFACESTRLQAARQQHVGLLELRHARAVVSSLCHVGGPGIALQDRHTLKVWGQRLGSGQACQAGACTGG